MAIHLAAPIYAIQRVVKMPTSTAVVSERPSINPFDCRPATARSNRLSSMGRTPQYIRPMETPSIAPTGVAQMADFDPHVTFTPAKTVKARTFTSSGMTAAWFREIAKAQFETHVRSSCHTLIAYERGSRTEGQTIVDGLPPSSMRDLTRKLVFVPAGADFRDQHTPRTNLSAIYFHFSPDILPDNTAANAPLVPLLLFENATLWSLMQKLRQILEQSALDDAPYFEALGSLLALEVARVRSSLASSRAPARGGLAPWQQRAVTNYIEENVSNAIPLPQLAGLVRLSQSHFCRAFKRSFGISPHRYHVTRRIELAKRMLLDGRETITNIGLDLGFGQASAFCTAFRKITGTTPSDYQRSAGECDLATVR